MGVIVPESVVCSNRDPVSARTVDLGPVVSSAALVQAQFQGFEFGLAWKPLFQAIDEQFDSTWTPLFQANLDESDQSINSFGREILNTMVNDQSSLLKMIATDELITSTAVQENLTGKTYVECNIGTIDPSKVTTTASQIVS